MSGHNKWSKIKGVKEKNDQQKNGDGGKLDSRGQKNKQDKRCHGDAIMGEPTDPTGDLFIL